MFFRSPGILSMLINMESITKILKFFCYQGNLIYSAPFITLALQFFKRLLFCRTCHQKVSTFENRCRRKNYEDLVRSSDVILGLINGQSLSRYLLILTFEKSPKFDYLAHLQISFFLNWINEHIIFSDIADLVIGFKISKFSSFRVILF